MWEDERGLRYRARYNTTSWGKDAYIAALENSIDSNSIGYQEVKEKCTVNETDGVKDLGEINLWEISNVTFAANEEAVNTGVKSAIEPEQNKTTIPYKRTALADEGMAWDGPAQVSGATVEQLRNMCACIDGDPNNNTSYKLPHHLKSGACVWAGVRAAYAATQGARTGQSGVQGCGGAESHLLKHYDDFGKPRPGKSDMEDIETKETKAGRVLSGANETELRNAAEAMRTAVNAIDGVLGKVTPAAPAAPTNAPGRSDSGSDLEVADNINELLIKRIQRIKEILE